MRHAEGDTLRSKARLARMREAMERAEVSAFLVSQPESRRYLSGYSAKDLPPRDSAGYLFVTEDTQYLLTDPRTEAQAVAEASGFDVRTYTGSIEMPNLLRELIAGAIGEVKAVGFEANHLPYAVWEAARDAVDGVATLVSTPGLVDGLRVVKDDEEIEALRQSFALNDLAFAYLARSLVVGRTELEMAWELESFARTHGAEQVAFDPITVAGPNTAVPHAVPSARPIGANEPVLFDTGIKVRGYCSDMTRTFWIDGVSPQLGDVWSVVLDAQLVAEAGVRPGMTAAEVDRTAREVIERAGYGERFVHSLGHGIGLEVHEPPWLSRARGSDVLVPGMVFSIEPAVYLPGVGGVRLEDVVLLKDDGAEVLTRSPKKPRLSEVLSDLDDTEAVRREV